MPPRREPAEPSSPLAAALDRVGDRWTLLVVSALLDGPSRFGELQELVPGVATNVLADRLRALERGGLVVGEPYSTRPLRLEYMATAGAAGLAGAIRLLAAWGSQARAAGGSEDVLAHGACGSPLEVGYWCATCEEPVSEDEELWV